LPSVCTAMSLRLPSYMFCLVSSSSPVICNYTVVQSSTVYTVKQVTFIHTFIQLYIHKLILSHINAYTSYTRYQFIRGCISHPQSCLTVSHQLGLLPVIIPGRKFLKNKHLAFTFLLIKNVIPIVSGPEMSLIISPVDFGGFFVKPSGLWRTRVKCLSKAEWILANLLSKAEWILANVYQKPSGFSQTFYQKPNGFSQTFYQKPSGFSQIFYQAEWILANVLPNRMDFRQTFISRTDSSQVFLLSKVSFPVM